MVSIAQNRTLPEVLQAIVANVASCQNVVATAIWLVNEGDLCETCRFRPQCPDQLRCLHYAAGAGNLVAHPQDLTPIENAFRRFPLGVPKIGAVAATGKPLLLPVLDGGGDWGRMAIGSAPKASSRLRRTRSCFERKCSASSPYLIVRR
jgi:hypothetical protein